MEELKGKIVHNPEIYTKRLDVGRLDPPEDHIGSLDIPYYEEDFLVPRPEPKKEDLFESELDAEDLEYLKHQRDVFQEVNMYQMNCPFTPPRFHEHICYDEKLIGAWNDVIMAWNKFSYTLDCALPDILSSWKKPTERPN